MRCYDFCLPEKEDWCVPSILQTILRSERIEMTQSEIADNFPEYFEDSIFRGLKFNQELLEKFLSGQGLTCSFHNPFTDFNWYQSSDLRLKNIEGDVLVSYNAKFQQREETQREHVGHVSIFLSYSMGSDLVELIDSDVLLPLLVRNMHPEMSSSHGFYVINDIE